MSENRKARPWIRLYTDLPSNPKVQRLPPPLFKFWVNCLCLYGKKGFLPEVKDISWALNIRENQVSENIGQLTSCGLFDELEDGVTPHDWDELQFESDTSRERQKAYRDRKLNRHHSVTRDVTRDVTVTPQEQSRVDTEQIQSRTEARARAFDEQWILFREAYEATGKPLIEEDFVVAMVGWVRLDTEQRALAIAGIAERVSAGQWADPNFILKPDRYLAGEYRRKVIQRTSGNGMMSKQQRILKAIEEA